MEIALEVREESRMGRIFGKVLLLGWLGLWTCNVAASDAVVPLFGVHEMVFQGPHFEATENPVSEVGFYTVWRHESGREAYRIHGFWDGDGAGQASGSIFKIRFCPTLEGEWTLVEAVSTAEELQGQRRGYKVTCVASDHPGFWIPDQESAGGRWYRRSNGTHPYIIGNTMYSFLSEYDQSGPTSGSIGSDIKGNAEYFRKVRFAITGDRYPNPESKPFLAPSGEPSDDGNFSHRPNPDWFLNRVDLAVREAYSSDLIADLIINGPDTKQSRSVLRCMENGGDSSPILRYIIARYGSFPNVWICIANEWDIKNPKYSAEEIILFGNYLKKYLPYRTPVSVHAAPTDWNNALNSETSWNDHVIVQYKIKLLQFAADVIEKNYWIGNRKPVINDELAYEGRGDGWTEEDVLEAHLGAFIGGGYGTTGFKDPVAKQGHYFSGTFDPSEHKSADNLRWLRDVIDKGISFWKMKPVGHIRFNGGTQRLSIFRNVHEKFRAMEWRNQEYLLATNHAWPDIKVALPKGAWSVKSFDVIKKVDQVLSSNASGDFVFSSPSSRATLIHVRRLGEE